MQGGKPNPPQNQPSMLQFLLSKLQRVIGVVVGATLIVFLLMHAIPGNPWDNYIEKARMMHNLDMGKTVRERLARHYGLDLPVWRQYIRYFLVDVTDEGKIVCGVACGNLGPSILKAGVSVEEVLFAPPEGKTFWQSRFGYSIRLVFFAWLIAVGFGIPLGFLSGIKPRSPASRAISVGLAALLAVPNFVLGLLAIIILASWLHVFKVLPDWTIPSNWIVPAVILAVTPLASIARVTHATIENILNEDFVRTARGKGLSESRVMVVHVLRNALGPILTFLGPTLMEMFAGLMVVEVMFGFPGFGREFWESVLKLDYPVVLGLTLVYAVGISVINMAVELLAQMVDPRLRSAEQHEAA